MDPEFSTEELLKQARGNQSAIWHLAVRRAREMEGSVDAWASYVGSDFAPSWDDLGDDASAKDVARITAMNMATTADMRPIEVSGDAMRARVVIEGPEADWLENMGTAVEDLDRTNELIFRVIAERRGMTLEAQREGSRLTLSFAKRDS
jgi:hypothetical protein